RLRQRDGCLWTQLLSRHRPGPPRAADHQPAELFRRSDGAASRHDVRGRDLLPGHRRHVRRADRRRSHRDAERCPDHHAVPGRRAADRQSVLEDDVRMRASLMLLLATIWILIADHAEAQSPIKIGFISPLTGAIAAAGKDMYSGCELYWQENG